MGKRTGKINGSIPPWKDRVKATRNAEAEARNKVYRALTLEQRLAKLDKLGLIAGRERARLHALIQKQKDIAEQKAKQTAKPQPNKEKNSESRTAKVTKRSV